MSVDEALQSSKIYDHSFLQILEIIGNFVDFLTLFGPAYFDVSGAGGLTFETFVRQRGV